MNLKPDLKNLIDFKQISILSERYLDVIIGDLKNTIILLLQSPIIATLTVMSWENANVDKSLYFVMSLTCVWFGCINSCREIVKEKGVYTRESMVNLNTCSYVISKILILTILCFIQCLILLLIIDQYLALPGNKFMIFLALFMCSVSGTGLGLFLSSIVDNEDKAIALVPLLIIPQILFSEILIPSDLHQGITIWIEKTMIVKWGFESIKEIVSTNCDIFVAIKYMILLACFTFIFTTGSIISLKIFKNRM
jgi:ABC-type multidrug transport system permease subunit